MTQRSVTYLKGRFETGDIPTQSDYQDLMDSFLNLEASASQTLSGPIVVPTMVVSAIDAARVSATTVSAALVYTNTLRASHVSASTVSAATATIDTVIADVVSANTIYADLVKVTTVSGNAATFNANVTAANIYAGTLMKCTTVSAASLFAGNGASIFTVSAINTYSTNAHIVSANIGSKLILSRDSTVSATGTTQATGFPLIKDVNFVFTTGDSNRAVVAATPEPGRVQWIINSTATVALVYPSPGCNFVGTAADARISLAAGGVMGVVHAGVSAYGIIRLQGV